MLETRNKLYLVYSNHDKRINIPILMIETFNLSWAILGSIFSYALANENTSRGALRDCTRDFGLGTNIMAGVFIVLSYV